MIVSDAGDWERRKGYKTMRGKLQDGMEALGTASEKYAEVTERW